MDRRTLLAFVLAGFILVIWSVLFPPAPPPEQAPGAGPDQPSGVVPASDTVAGGPTSGGPVAGSPGAQGRRSAPPEAVEGTSSVPGGAALIDRDGVAVEEPGAPRWEGEVAESVVIETDLLRARIDPLGGGLTEVELKEYPSGHAPGPVNLVREGQQAFDVGLSWGERGGYLSFANVPFEPRRVERPDIGPGGERVILTARRSDGLTCTREYTFRDGSYDVAHTVHVAGIPTSVSSPDLVVGWRTGIPFTEQNRQANQNYNAAIVRVGDEVSSWAPGKFKNGPRVTEGAVRWAAVSNKYFLVAMVPEPGTTTAVGADGDATSFRNAVWLELPAPSASAAQSEMKLYLGPKDFDQLQGLGAGLGDAVKLGYSWIRPLSRLMLAVMKATYRFVPNYGLVIIILSVLVRLMLFPLNQTSMRSMKAMQQLQPEMEALKKKYADKPQDLNKQMMLLYKKHNVNPLGGCLPMIVQMPVLFALYFAFMFAIDLRMAPFVFWIQDLSTPDTVAKIGGFPIHVLPLVMTGVSVLQARSTPTDPRQAMMTTLMPVMFLVFFYNMPAGLVLYWTMSSLATWVQQRWMNRGEPARRSTAGGAAGPSLVDLFRKRQTAAGIPASVGEQGTGDGDRVVEKEAVEKEADEPEGAAPESMPGPDRGDGQGEAAEQASPARRDRQGSGNGRDGRGKRSGIKAGATRGPSQSRRRRRRS